MEQGSKRYLTFRVARKDLALEAARVRAILPIEELVTIPSARPGVIGFVALTNANAMVIDLRERLNIQPASPGPQRKVVVVSAIAGRLAGFVADRVSDVVRYRARDLRRGVLYGIGRPRRVVEIDEVVSEDDLVRIWPVEIEA